jgi:hypothetical protein
MAYIEFVKQDKRKWFNFVTLESSGELHTEQNVGQLGLRISVKGTVLPPLPVQVIQTDPFR